MCSKRPFSQIPEASSRPCKMQAINLKGKLSEAFGKRYVGAHVSAAGGAWNAFSNTLNIGGTAMALFLKNQRKWDSVPFKDEDIKKFKDLREHYGFDSSKILPHGSYLINLGNPDEAKRVKSYESFVDDVKRCHALGIGLYNLHPGSTVGNCSISKSVELVAESINRVHQEVEDVCIVLETMAGQGNSIGNKFEDLQQIISLVIDKERIGVCIDTCHIFAAGYDIRTRDSYLETMDKFDKAVGFKYLKGLHLNDSKADLGSGVDRHENLGQGKIGLNAFRFLMNDDRFKNIPMILETPAKNGLEVETYSKEIKLLYSLLDQSNK